MINTVLFPIFSEDQNNAIGKLTHLMHVNITEQNIFTIRLLIQQLDMKNDSLIQHERVHHV